MVKQRRSRDKSFSQEEDLHSVIIVIFNKGTTPKEIRRIVASLGCRLQEGYDGKDLVNVVCVPEGKTDVQCIQKFLALTQVKKALQNEVEVTL